MNLDENSLFYHSMGRRYRSSKYRTRDEISTGIFMRKADWSISKTFVSSCEIFCWRKGGRGVASLHDRRKKGTSREPVEKKRFPRLWDIRRRTMIVRPGRRWHAASLSSLSLILTKLFIPSRNCLRKPADFPRLDPSSLYYPTFFSTHPSIRVIVFSL